MSTYLTQILNAFLPLVMILGLLAALAKVPLRGHAWRALALAVGLGLVLGWAGYSFAMANGAEVRTRSAMRLLELIALIIVLIMALRPRTNRWCPILLPFIALLMSTAGLHTIRVGTADQIFTTTGILNSELISNSAAVAMGFALIVAMAVLLAHLGRSVPVISRCVLLTIVLLVGTVAAADVLLGGLQLGLIGATSGRVRLVAQAGHYSASLGYVLLALVALIIFAHGLRWYSARNSNAAESIPMARKRRAANLATRRWISTATGLAVFVMAAFLYHDLYASLPPRLSAAAEALPDADDRVRIPLDEVKDGKLHRFAYIAGDGHRVRFFLINRYDEDHVKIGVVFDACMICGDDGYIQKGNDVICIACNVHIFVPSIGKPGGCNPIPLTHEVMGDEIIIARSDLERGARYFSEIVEITVTDPVTGASLKNLDAPYQYEFRGHTFFFEGKESYEQFKAEPEKFAGDTPARAWRVQGHEVTRG